MPTPGCLIAALLTSLAVLPAVKGQERGRGLDATLVLEVPVEGDTTVFLQRPVGATRFDNGVLAVADGMAPSVHFFDGDGRFMKSAGRAGEGPGEYSTPGWLGRCAADAATVWDFSLLRLTTVDETGAIRDQDDLRNVVDLPRPPSRMACSRTGGLMALLRLSGERVEGDDEVGVLTAPDRVRTLASSIPGSA
jgi:hypothetical protein